MKRARKPLLVVGTALLVYVVVYIANSGFGGYWWPMEHQDGFRWNTYYGLTPLPTTILWQPRYGHLSYKSTDGLGLLFIPLIRCDQALVHRTIDIERDSNHNFAALIPSSIHPDCRKEFLELKTKAANNRLQQAPNRHEAGGRY